MGKRPVSYVLWQDLSPARLIVIRASAHFTHIVVNPTRVFGVTLLLAVCALRVAAQEGGYVSPLSVVHGDSIFFHLSSSREKDEVSFRIFRDGTSKAIWSTSAVNSAVRAVPDTAWERGCGWPASVAITVPDIWTPGVYYA